MLQIINFGTFHIELEIFITAQGICSFIHIIDYNRLGYEFSLLFKCNLYGCS